MVYIFQVRLEGLVQIVAFPEIGIEIFHSAKTVKRSHGTRRKDQPEEEDYTKV